MSGNLDDAVGRGWIPQSLIGPSGGLPQARPTGSDQPAPDAPSEQIDPKQPSALSPEDYADVLREIRARAANYHGQVGADVDWLLAQVGIALRAAPAPEGPGSGLSSEEYDALVRDAMRWRHQAIAPPSGALPAEPSTMKDEVMSSGNPRTSSSDQSGGPATSEGCDSVTNVRPALDHPEAFCKRCGGRNATWFAPSPIWNQAVPEGGILCPVCFIHAAEKAGIQPPAWCVSPELAPVLPAEPSEAAWRGHLVALRNLGYNIPQADALAILRAYLAAERSRPEGPAPAGEKP